MDHSPHDSAKPDGPSWHGRDPLAILRAEHVAILQALAALERDLQAVADGAPFAPARWRTFAAFFAEFADRRHHAKEEDLLFPLLVRHGLGDDGPVGVMRVQHQEARALARTMERGAAAGDASAAVTAARAYLDLLREHIQIEDDLLWPMAQEVLPAAALAGLVHAFAGVDRALGVRDGLAEFAAAAAAL